MIIYYILMFLSAVNFWLIATDRGWLFIGTMAFFTISILLFGYPEKIKKSFLEKYKINVEISTITVTAFQIICYLISLHMRDNF